MADLSIPISPGRWIEVNVTPGSFPLSEEEYQRLIAVLEAMKPAIVRLADQEARTDG